MKKFKKLIVSAFGVLMALSAVASSAFATSADNRSRASVQDGIVERQPMSELPDISEMTLVGTAENTEGDLRIVVDVYEKELSEEDQIMVQNSLRERGMLLNDDQIDVQNATQGASGSKIIEARMKVYNSASQSSIQLMEMYVGGVFFWMEDRNDVYIVQPYEPKYTKLVSQLYPSINEKSFTRENNQGGYWGGNRYAYMEYVVGMKKSADEKEISCSLYLEVNVKGVRRVVCSPSKYCYEV